MESWLRIAIFAVILISFLRRLLKIKGRAAVPTPPPNVPSAQVNLPPTVQNEFPSTITPSMTRPRFGRKNDFRDVPPPPENPNLG
ncbi:MAG: hypothetical protein WBV46_09440 [Terriglobales bacterium]|jgi:hypothetical protein